MDFEILVNMARNMALFAALKNDTVYRFATGHARKKQVELCSSEEARAIISAASPKPKRKEHICERKWPDVPEFDISIIVPCYKVEKYVAACINSCLNQKTTRSFEVIAVDDGSPDRTFSILDSIRMRDDRLKIVRQENQGLSGARNTAIACAAGATLVFVDSDDMLKPDALELLADAYDKSGCDFVTASFEAMSEDGKRVRPIKGRRTHGAPWARIFSREIWRKLEYPDKYWFEDTVLGFYVRGRYSEFYLDQSVYLYRSNHASITKNGLKNKRGLESYWIVEELLDRSREYGVPYDQMMHDRVISQLGPILFTRCQALDERERKALFVCACDLLEKWGLGYTCGKGGRWNDLEEALRRRNYALWKVVVHSIGL